MLILCSDIDMVERYVAPVSDKVGELLLGSDRPTTVIMPLCKSLLANNLAAANFEDLSQQQSNERSQSIGMGR